MRINANPFVLYLLKRGILAPDEAERVEQWADHHQDPLALIAVEHGLVVGSQLVDLLESQKQGGVMFGALCVERGYLSAEGVDRLLRIQRHRRGWRAVEALILSGILPECEVLRAFGGFVMDDEGRESGGLAAAA